jgi:ATP-binding cassette subfamily B (MDR/TAP) protein 1
VSYVAYAIAFAYGGRLVSEGSTDAGAVLNCVMAILVGTFSISAAAPEMQHVFKGRAAAAKLWETIDRVPVIDSAHEGGAQPPEVAGRIEFNDVTFRYPSRPDTTVLHGLSTVFEAGQTTALVGPSGGGKSTVIALIERFYDPASGGVTLDGAALPSLNLRWLRGQIGLVSQEPVLFATSIRENVEMGLVGTPYEAASAEEKDALVRGACEAANAGFVERLPKGYDTEVGERGARLSGGQRQRIAIARAIVSNPRILLLDEATSALDAHAERVVQDALDRAAKGRTTVVIAHRLATVRNADKILVVADGRVVEQGTHDSLLTLGGVYAGLVEHQKLEESEAEEGAAATKTTLEEDAELVHLEAVAEEPEKKKARFGLRAISARVFRINRDMWGWYALCFAGAIVNGMAFPVYAILLGLTIADFELPQWEIKGALENKAIFFFVVALVAGLSVLCEILGSQRTGWELSRKLRSAAFRSTLRRPIAWFDGENSGGLVARISDGPEKIQGLFGVTLGAALKAFVTIIGGIIVGLAYAPLLALVGLGTVPLVFSAGYIRLRVVVLAAARVQAVHQSSAQMATEAVGALKTVISLRRERDVQARYSNALGQAAARSTHTSLRSNALYAASQAMSFLAIALVFYVGARFVADGRYDTQRFFTGLTAVVLAAVNSGSVFGFVPDAGQASAAAKSVFGLIDGPPAPEDGEKGVAPGHLRLEDVHFAYPSDPTPVLHGLSLDVPPGAFVALVGPSGCGKSTVLALLERFYTPDGGRITLGAADIASLDVTAYRAIMAIVSQEPVLYSGSLRFNISLGAPDPDAVSDADIWAAAEGANIAEFIRGLPQGMETDIGDHGAQLSGGQRQRVAIARALLRNPSILLLDEATAALDSASERAVQAALEAARHGRSVIAVAHRLSTIQHADVIFVMKAGAVVEKGTHAELMALKGEYYELVQVQNVSAA